MISARLLKILFF